MIPHRAANTNLPGRWGLYSTYAGTDPQSFENRIKVFKEETRMKKQYLWMIAVVVVVLVATLVLASCGGDSTTTTAAPAGPTTTAAGPATTAGGATTTAAGGTVDAAALYAQYCVGCHKDLPTGSVDDQKAVIEKGKESMPGFADKMTAAQIAALAAWVANGGK
jgi:mono/diheme cytochrome c family protein